MEHYAGIDVSLELSSVCVVDAQGKIVKEVKIASEPEAFIAFFQELGFAVKQIGLEAGPLSQWLHAGLKVARQLTEAFPWNEAPRHLIRDRDRIYGAIVKCRLRAMGIRDKPTALASPWQNGFAKRLIGSIRRECVDHFIVLGEAHLRRILRSYAGYYNNIRTHWSLAIEAKRH